MADIKTAGLVTAAVAAAFLAGVGVDENLLDKALEVKAKNETAAPCAYAVVTPEQLSNLRILEQEFKPVRWSLDSSMAIVNEQPHFGKRSVWLVLVGARLFSHEELLTEIDDNKGKWEGEK